MLTGRRPARASGEGGADAKRNHWRMSNSGQVAKEHIRAEIVADPTIVLDDVEVIKALATAANFAFADNVVDMRGMAMQVLENRLRRIEDSKRRVVAASYENLAGTLQTQRAVLAMVEPDRAERFFDVISQRIPEILKIACVRLLAEENGKLRRVPGAECFLVECPPGSIANYLEIQDIANCRDAILRGIESGDTAVYGDFGPVIRSEALVPLIDADRKQTWLLILGSPDPKHYQPGMGTDLLEFFGAVFQRVCRRWLT